ncbi:hypothetical protein [Imhoffiella purpurea]|uniref:Uncharacterized protein n=1 Tax=Imhoffiella purpurea TaxID=1249627 RepID=W9V8G0_9GAMM|nr:hypothetical protein [Imhoffiella purpurea]EXJ15863.1 hypothetical protein D779_0945 [Imhoffiella purpurea]
MNHSAKSTDPFLEAFYGSFTAALRWPQLDALWSAVRECADLGWYLYAVGEAPPSRPADPDQVLTFLDEMDALLRAEHPYDYCGIVYADDPRRPSFVKIYDPHNLGVSCGCSAGPLLPGWVMSLLPPSDLQAVQVVPNARRRWWRRLFG